MITEIEVPNPDLKLVPGMYATVVLKVEKHPNALAIPIEAVAGGQTPTVYVVNQDNQIEERAVTLGLETPDNYEVLSGLKEGDLVVIGNRSGFRPARKSSRSSSSFPCAMKIEIKPLTTVCVSCQQSLSCGE